MVLALLVFLLVVLALLSLVALNFNVTIGQMVTSWVMVSLSSVVIKREVGGGGSLVGGNRVDKS